MLTLLVVLTPQMIGCMTTSRAIKQERFKAITYDIDCDNPREVRLAQNLYIEMMNQ
jgi:hypothetical protein